MKRIIEAWEHKGWGDNIGWTDFDKRLIYGLMTPKPNVGDEVREKMQSGLIACFTIVDIEYPGNPPDMFFATLEDSHYL